jgi:hypothetical protein
MAVKPIDPEVAEAVRKRMRFRHEIEMEIDKIQSQIRKGSQDTYLNFMEKVADQAGIDLKELNEEGLRRHEVERRLVERGYESITARVQEFVQEEAKRRREAEQQYYERFLKDLIKGEGNPCQLVWEPDDFPPGEIVTTDGPGGMVGYACKPPVMAAYDHSSTIDLSSTYSSPHHMFYPSVEVSTGADDSHVWLRLDQNVWLRRRELPGGRGSFNVERLQIWLSGTGYCDSRSGHPPLFGPGILGPTAEARIELHANLAQRYDHSPDGYHYSDLLHNRYHWVEYDDYTGDARVTPYIGASEPATIYSPDEGGHEIYVYFSLQSYVGAFADDAQARLDFSADGLSLIDIRLCGSYAS